MSDGPSVRTRGGQDKQREEMKKKHKDLEKKRTNRKNGEEDPFHTPQKKIEFNALDERRVRFFTFLIDFYPMFSDHRELPARSRF